MATKLFKPNRSELLADFANLPPDAFVDLVVVMALLDASKASIMRWSKAGYIPEPSSFNRTLRWNVGALRELLGMEVEQ